MHTTDIVMRRLMLLQGGGDEADNDEKRPNIDIVISDER
jgi:hypothetical protein